MNYTLFIDESGQSGIKKIQTAEVRGSSRYMTLGGVLIPNVCLDDHNNQLKDLTEKFGKPSLHCSRLNHDQICRFAKDASNLKSRFFGMISLKETLQDYGEEIENDDKKYYNKCAQYLLERVGMFMAESEIQPNNLSVVFESGNFEYSKLRGLISACRKNPIRPASKYLSYISPWAIGAKPKSEEPLLQYADLIAHSLFRCVDDALSRHGVQETRYLTEIKSNFWSDKNTGLIVGKGIYCVHSLKDIKVNAEVFAMLNQLKPE